MKREAIIDPTGNYRYSLARIWDRKKPQVTLIMFNPSRADAEIDDPTIRRCTNFARSWNFGTLEVVNLFAYRTASPQQLRQLADPIGQECDRYLLAAVDRAASVVLAWGNNGKLYNRDRSVLRLLARYRSLYCLGYTQQGQPRHPLYLPRDLHLVPFDGSRSP